MIKKSNFTVATLVSAGYVLLIICLFLYSFTQVDLNLTLSRASWFQTVEKAFQYLGYFNRPLSTYLYIAIIVLLFAGYGMLLWLSYVKKITKKQVWVLLLLTTVILVFSYNAFSYDIFNYIFDAKIITFYHQSPYIHRALDFPQDKMLHFMRWTHRYYPYGPVWLMLTIPLSFLGLQLFLPTFFLFKFLMAGSFLGTCYCIQKICRGVLQYAPTEKGNDNEIYSLVFFAFNPLVLIESLVSAHLDIVMMFFAMLALWLCMQKKWIRTLFLLVISIGVKFATAFLLPTVLSLFAIEQIPALKKRFAFFAKANSGWGMFFVLSSLLMSVSVVAASYTSGNFQPWYLLTVLPLASLVARKYYILIPVISMTFFSLLEYVPFLYRGDWNPPVPTILFWLTASGIIVSVIGTIYTQVASSK